MRSARKRPAGNRLPKLIAIVGPTASGKTDLALALAKRFGGEVISADSRQFYRGMRIGAGVPEGAWATKRGVRAYWVEGIAHHCMAFRSPAQGVTMAGFQRMVARKVREITSRGHVPILVGGTGLYVDAVLENFTIPRVPANPAFRRSLERKATTTLFAELRAVDPAYAARISSENRRYIVRALEVARATGRPFSQLQRRGEPRVNALRLGVTRSREELVRRIDARVDAMLAAGLLREARRLRERYSWELPALSSLGHRQMGQFLRGEIPLEEAIRLTKQETRRYAKRQMTWFRRDARIRWVTTAKEAERLATAFLASK